MKNIEDWKETLVIYDDDEIVINEQYVGDRSLLVANQNVQFYEKVIKEHAAGVLLDLGCGTVPYFKIYQDQVENVICIDWDNSYHKNVHLDYTADLNLSIPLKSNSIDTVILTDVLEHISKPHYLMDEISRVLQENGKLILGVPFMYWLHEEPFDYHRYTKYKLQELCKSNDLGVLSIIEVGGPLTVIGDIIAKNIPTIFMARLFQKSLFWFLQTRLGKKIDNRNKHKFPRSYCLIGQKIK